MDKFRSSMEIAPLKDGEFSEKIPEIQTLLKACEVTGEISSFDGLKLRYYYYLCEKPVGAVLIVHGYTEFARKYEEIIYYFLQNGYNCFIYDQRSHGHSGSELSDRSHNHVNDFGEYGKDLNAVMEQVVRPHCGFPEINIFCHSMGGCVTLLYLHEFQPADIRKCVFTSPMIKPRMAKNLPFWLVKASILKSVKKDGWNAPFPHTPHFNPNAQFDSGHDLSRARFEHNLKLRISDPNYQNSGSTNRWLYECMYVHKQILTPGFLSKITPEILILKAGKDTVVYTQPYDDLNKYLPNCRISEYPDSRHSIYNSDDETLIRYWKEVFDFLK